MSPDTIPLPPHSCVPDRHQLKRLFDPYETSICAVHIDTHFLNRSIPAPSIESHAGVCCLDEILEPQIVLSFETPCHQRRSDGTPFELEDVGNTCLKDLE